MSSCGGWIHGRPVSGRFAASFCITRSLVFRLPAVPSLDLPLKEQFILHARDELVALTARDKEVPVRGRSDAATSVVSSFLGICGAESQPWKDGNRPRGFRHVHLLF